MLLTTVKADAQSTVADPIIVPNDWPLKPASIGVNEQFRLLFVTHGESDARSKNIADYNSFVQEQAGDSTAHPSLRPHASKFRVVGSTGKVSAVDNTSMTGTGVPIYWVNGSRVADNYNDFYDGSWNSEEGREQSGKVRRKTGTKRILEVHTGSNDHGRQAYFKLGGQLQNYNVPVRYVEAGVLYSVYSDRKPLSSNIENRVEWDRPFYAISPVFQTKPGVRVVRHPSERSEFKEGYAGYFPTAGVVSLVEMHPPPSNITSVTVQITDDTTADFLPDEEEGTRELSFLSLAKSHQFAFKTKADPYTNVDGTIRLEVIKAPEGYDIVENPLIYKVKNDPDTDHPLVTVASLKSILGQDSTITEGGAAIFRISIPEASESPLTVNVQAQETGGDFLSSQDELKRTFTIKKNETYLDVWYITQRDALNDNNGTVILNVLPGTDYRTTDSSRTATVDVKNDPSVTNLILNVEDVSVDEGSDAVLRFELYKPPDKDATFKLTTRPGTATAVNDYKSFNQMTYTWPSGQKTATFSIPTIENDIYEGDETFGVMISQVKNLALPGNAKEKIVTVTIEDDTDLPVLSLSSPQASEGGKLRFTASLSNASDLDISTRYEDTGVGTAKSGVRYNALKSGTLTFAPGVTTREIVINVLKDQVNQTEDETVILRLSRPKNTAFLGKSRVLEATGVILADVIHPEVRLSETVKPVHEGEDAIFHAQVLIDGKVAPWNKDITFVWFAVPNTQHDPNGATSTWNSDFTPINGQITIPAGKVSVPITVETKKDKEDEGTETLGIRIFSAYFSGTTDSVDFDTDHWVFTNIHDNAAILIGDPPETPEGRVMVFTVDLGSPAVDDVSFTWTTEDGTATAGQDYTAANGQITIPAGELTANIRVATLQDIIDEPRQTLDVALVKTAGTVEEARLRATGVIRDDDPRPNLTVPNVQVGEGDTAQFRATLSAVSEKPITAEWKTEDGTATVGQDYETANGQITIPAGSRHADIAVVTTDDDVSEKEEQFRILLSKAPEAKITAGGGIGTIIDNDSKTSPVSQLNLSISDTTVTEGSNAQAVFTVRLSKPPEASVSVNWKTEATGTGDGFAMTGGSVNNGLDDYVPVAAKTLSFTAGQQEKQVTVQVKNDNYFERDETFRVVLENPVGAVISDGEGIGTIRDDDQVRFWIANKSTHIREGESLTVRVRRSDASYNHTISARTCLADGGTATRSNSATSTSLDDDVYIDVRHSKTHDCSYKFTHADSSSIKWINFPSGVFESTFTIHTIQDTRVEGDETFIVKSLGGTSKSIGILEDWFSQEFTIIDDDVRRLRVERSNENTIWEGDKVSWDLYVDPPFTQRSETATVKFRTGDGTAKAGKDYVAHPDTTLTLRPGRFKDSPVGTIKVQTSDDNVIEDDETFTLTFHTPSSGLEFPVGVGSNYTLQETIHDDDLGTISLSDTVVDEGDTASVAVELSQAISHETTITWETVSGTATSPADFQAVTGGTVTVPAGKGRTTIEVVTTQDKKDEADEDFQVRVKAVSTPTNFRTGSTASITIKDDDDSHLGISGLADARINENTSWSSPIPTVTGMPVGDVAWAVEGDDATLFRLAVNTGQLTLPAQDFEAKADHDKNNRFEVTVRATDEDGTTATVDVTVTVLDIDWIGTMYVQKKTDKVAEGGSARFQTWFAPSAGYSQFEGKVPLQWRTIPLAGDAGIAAADSDDFRQVVAGGPVNPPVRRSLDGGIFVDVQTLQDNRDEPYEAFQVEFFTTFAEGDILLNSATHTVTITDDDATPVKLSTDDTT
ncbi:MAG: hypothetical protein OXG21_10360, partial [Rhodobacteraceae bacterium]|nr:hypothetical protein [Paracoccaceae bacterium]